MSSLYAKFVKEICNWETVEDEVSFVTYELQNVRSIRCLKIIEMYVHPDHRSQGRWVKLVEKIEDTAKSLKCNKFSATISKATPEYVQKRTAHMCEKVKMVKTYEDIYSIIYMKDLSYE